jgi:hypothetical protein
MEETKRIVKAKEPLPEGYGPLYGGQILFRLFASCACIGIDKGALPSKTIRLNSNERKRGFQ